VGQSDRSAKMLTVRVASFVSRITVIPVYALRNLARSARGMDPSVIYTFRERPEVGPGGQLKSSNPSRDQESRCRNMNSIAPETATASAMEIRTAVRPFETFILLRPREPPRSGPQFDLDRLVDDLPALDGIEEELHLLAADHRREALAIGAQRVAVDRGLLEAGQLQLGDLAVFPDGERADHRRVAPPFRGGGDRPGEPRGLSRPSGER